MFQDSSLAEPVPKFIASKSKANLLNFNHKNCDLLQNFPELNQLNSLRHGETVLVPSPMTRHTDEHHHFLQSASSILPHPFFHTQFPMTPWLERLERLVFP